MVKSLHELGHAFATKVWGGEVHEVGLMLLVFIPVLYVDASASAAFRQKHRRIVVGAAGILVETTLAALAVIVWVYGSPGIGRAIAFNVILIGGVSTLLFNGNPLLRFDGYYIFSDLIEVPNLATRANAYLFYVIQKHLFKIDSVDSPVADRRRSKMADQLCDFVVPLPDGGVGRHCPVPVGADVRHRHRDGAVVGRRNRGDADHQGLEISGDEFAVARPQTTRLCRRRRLRG